MSPQPRLWSGPGLVALLGCLLLVVAVTVATPDPLTDLRRRWQDVGIGTWGDLADASVRVTSIRLTRSLTSEYGPVLTSDGTFVVVAMEAQVHREDVSFSKVTLQTRDERLYEPRQEFAEAGLTSTDPGFTRTATEVFEVPDDRVRDAVLVVDRDGAAFDVYATAVRVDLGLHHVGPVEPGPVTVARSSTVTVTR